MRLPAGENTMSEDKTTAPARCPIDFDHNTREHAANWPQEFREIRERCPRAWTDSHGGFWIASKYKDLISIAQKPDSFTTLKEYDRKTGDVKGGLLIPPLPSVRAVPNETESPEWDSVRNFLNRRFSPKAVEQYRDKARQYAAALIDLVIEKGKFDIVDEFTNPLPALVTMDLFGFPLREWRKFADPFHKMIYTPKDDPEFLETMKGLDYFRQRVDEEIEIRRKHPSDDLLGYLAAGTIDGQPLNRDRIQDISFNILAGGVDTTTALTSNVLLHLSRNPDQRQRLIDEPELLKFAREEFVRYFTPAHAAARTAKQDVTVDGWQFMKGDRVLLAWASGNRDAEEFENPDEVKLDRFPNRHVGFGAGMHRCLGSFFARMKFETMVTEVLARIPDYQVVEDEILPYTTRGAVNGWIHIPATFTPGTKVGALIA
jgi:cytochrome P450